MKKVMPFLVVAVSLLSGCATSPPTIPLPPTAQLNAQTFLTDRGYSKPALPPDQHLHPVTPAWMKTAGGVTSWPILGLVLSEEYKLQPNQAAGGDARTAAANANSMATISAAGIESAAGAPELGGASMAFDALTRLLGANNRDAATAQVSFFRRFSDADAHLPVSKIAPVLQEQMQILAALHQGVFYAPMAFNGNVYQFRPTPEVRQLDFNLSHAVAYVGPGYWDISWKELRPSPLTYVPSAFGDASMGLRAALHNYTVTVGHLQGNKMLTVAGVQELQRKLPFLKDWYVVFNTPTSDGGHEWVVFKDGKLLESIPIRES